ncbi:hypothetical protein BC936DRAFT_146953 [Jimgerdemannia flammicorona]|uniref:Uncharacterized protein n=1 Tax=Jimgerdemannia flammicorona TaxID=994334 RepID=A0A433D6F2_9FUNG|nr:hypothetical protein BC936DRAFT_146953 [Jimgerdemannia flammicorona]
MLPIILKMMMNSAEVCATRAEETRNKFSDVLILVQELLEASTAAEGASTEQEWQNRVARKVLEDLKGVEERKAREEGRKMLSEGLKTTEKQFKEAAKSILSAWGMIRMNLVEGIANSVVGTLSFASCPIGFILNGAARKSMRKKMMPNQPLTHGRHLSSIQFS